MKGKCLIVLCTELGIEAKRMTCHHIIESQGLDYHLPRRSPSHTMANLRAERLPCKIVAHDFRQRPSKSARVREQFHPL